MRKTRYWSDALDVDTRPVVMVIEDDPDLREALSDTLRVAGYRVIEAADGDQVIGNWHCVDTDDGELIEVDLVVTDQRMPRATGLDVLRDLRSRDWATQVVLISAFVDPELRDRARRLGACAVLAKPFDMQELIDTVERALPA